MGEGLPKNASLQGRHRLKVCARSTLCESHFKALLLGDMIQQEGRKRRLGSTRVALGAIMKPETAEVREVAWENSPSYGTAITGTKWTIKVRWALGLNVPL